VILRDIDSPKFEQAQTSQRDARPVWEAIEASQKRLMGVESAWLITQPAHSALSGEIAARLASSAFGHFDDGTIRAIALHDAGWSGFDSELIRASRGSKQKQNTVMVPFLAAAAEESINAWTGSIETALRASPIGGFLVSEHFRSLAQTQAAAKPASAKLMAQFISQEDARQAKLRPKVSLQNAALARLVNGLRFCDLLSLYLCAGIQVKCEFPQQIQLDSIVVTPAGEDTFKLQPTPFSRPEVFSFSALRHPRTKTVSSATFLCKITG
jgi:hypothetical protein